MTDNGAEYNESFNDNLQAYQGVRVLVTGATGFIGRWTARKLCTAGAKVFLPVRELAAAKSVFADYGIEGEICELDLLNANAVGELIRIIRPAIIFNLAGYGIDRTETEEDLAYRINARLVENLCLQMVEIGDSDWSGQNIVHVGTAMEYGAISGDLAESSAPNPTTLYGKSKLSGTMKLERCCRENGLKGLTARLFAVYGPGETPARLLPTLIDAAKTGKAIALTAGLHERDFIYVEDAAEGILRLGLSSAKPGEIINLATGKLCSIRNFTETAAREIGISGGRLNFGALPTRTEEMKHDPVNIERLRNLTGWKPPTTIAEGVRKTLTFEQKSATRSVG